MQLFINHDLFILRRNYKKIHYLIIHGKNLDINKLFCHFIFGVIEGKRKFRVKDINALRARISSTKYQLFELIKQLNIYL